MHDMLVKSLDAFDRWAMIAAAAEALGYANLLDQAGWLTPDMIQKIREAATTFGTLATKPFQSYDVRTGFINAPTYARLFADKTPFSIPDTSVASAARDVIVAVMKTRGDSPDFKALMLPFTLPDEPAPNPATPAYQVTRSLPIILALLQADAGVDSFDFDAYLDDLGKLAKAAPQNAITQPMLDAYVLTADPAFAAFDLRFATVEGAGLVAASTGVLKPIDPGIPDNDPNAADFKPAVFDDSTLPPYLRGFPINVVMSYRAGIVPRTAAPSLPSYAGKALPGEAVDRTKFPTLTATTSPPLGVTFEWVSKVGLDHLELRLYESDLSTITAEDIAKTKPKIRFVYKKQPDGTLASSTRLPVTIPPADGASFVFVEVIAVDVEGTWTSTCNGVTLLRFDGKVSAPDVPAVPPIPFSGVGRCQVTYPKPPLDMFDDPTPTNYVVLTPLGTWPYRPAFGRVLDPGATSFIVHNASATDTFRLRSLYTPPRIDSGYDPIGTLPPLDTGDVAPGAEVTVSVPAGTHVWWLADPAHMSVPLLVRTP
jgi:hypothetical protein